MADFLSILDSRARSFLKPAEDGDLSPTECIALYRRFIKIGSSLILRKHRSGVAGLEVARDRASLLDTTLRSILASARRANGGSASSITLSAIGGFGRGILNPASDIDILFLLPRASTQLPKSTQDLIQSVLYILWDLGFKVGHTSRSIGECIAQARLDQENMTALMDARYIDGDRALFEKFMVRFAKECVQRNQASFFERRRADIDTRHNKYSNTVFLQEPNVKESCGGMRDFHNIQWVARVKTGDSSLSNLVDKKIITAASKKELEAAYDFLHRVRNELHYHTGKATDQLTLFLQGVVATAFKYPQRNILRSTEAFMRDYYHHTRHIYHHTLSIMEYFQIERADRAASGLTSFLTFRKKKREEFDGFVARQGMLFPSNPGIFKEDPNRLMRLFQHCQVRDLALSPPLRRLIAQHWGDIDRPFRYAKANRQVFQAILERKGDVARVLRQMHRIGFLGRYLPEFGALDCLVQHEFFHRYTADEHTLRCIDQLDQLTISENPAHAIYRRLFHEVQDAYGLYLAVILHDTGRAENVREHTDGSAMLAARLCNRLQISGPRRSLIMFLVDNHLTFWRHATTRNLDDPAVIAEFASIVKTPSNLDALFLFTYVDSNGTSPDAWTGWKESLMVQLHRATHRFLANGPEAYEQLLAKDREALRERVQALAGNDLSTEVADHFQRMPDAAFNYREPAHIVTQIRTVRHFLQAEAGKGDPYASAITWMDYADKGFSELVFATRDKPLVLEKICCALASEEINILSADFFTRTDGIVVNIFRVCTTNFEPVSSTATRKRLEATFETIAHAEHYQPEKYLRRRMNYLKSRSDDTIPVPVRAYVSNELHPQCTTIELQALDRIGLLHDLFHAINLRGHTTAHARICTEKGVAMDTLYIIKGSGGKIDEPDEVLALEACLADLVARKDS